MRLDLDALAQKLREQKLRRVARRWRDVDGPRICLSDGCEREIEPSRYNHPNLCNACRSEHLIAAWCSSCGRQLHRADQQAPGRQRGRCQSCRLAWMEYANPAWLESWGRK